MRDVFFNIFIGPKSEVSAVSCSLYFVHLRDEQQLEAETNCVRGFLRIKNGPWFLSRLYRFLLYVPKTSLMAVRGKGQKLLLICILNERMRLSRSRHVFHPGVKNASSFVSNTRGLLDPPLPAAFSRLDFYHFAHKNTQLLHNENILLYRATKPVLENLSSGKSRTSFLRHFYIICLLSLQQFCYDFCLRITGMITKWFQKWKVSENWWRDKKWIIKNGS